ncbi:MAG: hypothetical protein GF346_12675 [Candidatus Eisenbacteria bacterium]|nr:hypothetical protein [Candidatus Latescibacterota bacterium]MBD3303291.1 hypothetical protein [Candidatus Eisenbacteria bacterium]
MGPRRDRPGRQERGAGRSRDERAGQRRGGRLDRDADRLPVVFPSRPGTDVQHRHGGLRRLARIIYGVQGEGRGHSSRSRVVIEHLLASGHEVRIFTSHKGYEHLRPHFEGVTEIFGLVFAFEGEKLDLLGTLRRNLERGSGELPETVMKMARIWKEFRPQIAVTDFEPWVPYARTILGIPFLSIDHQHVLSHYRLEYPYRWRPEYLQARAVVDGMVRGAERYLVTSFFFPEPRGRGRRRATLVGPILRREVLARTAERDGPILVYATTAEARQALDLLRGRPEECLAYGFGRDEGRDGNIRFRPPSVDRFLDDLAAARAVVTNGGYTLMSEALYLGTPIYAIPIRNQFEQMINGYQLERLGYGLFDLDPVRRRLQQFLDGIAYFRANIERDRRVPAGPEGESGPDRFNGNPHLFALLDERLGRLA